MTVTFGSVCSGIEAASVAWEPLGWRAAWFAEIEPFPSAVLAHQWPDTPNHGDMMRLPALVSIGAIPAPDVLVGGTPCQAFSIAGLRGSLDDDRGALTLKFVELANAIDRKRTEPCVIVWENVPGVLNTKDNAFGCFLAGLAGEDEPLVAPRGRWTNAGHVSGPQRTIAWRVLDAQYFGVAQRRRRVFVVASARDGFDPCEILFEREGVRRDTPPSRKEGEDVAGTLASRTGAGGFPGTDEALSGYVRPCITGDITHTLKADGFDGSEDGTGRGTPIVASTYQPVSHCLNAGGMGRIDYETESFVVQSVSLRGREGGGTAELGDDESPTLRASSDGGDKPHVLAFSSKDYGADASDNISPTLRAGGHSASHANAGVPHAVLHHGVRRLTPTECERLQGFPDGHTLVPYRNKPAADGPRYKAIGNSMAVPVMHWIGKRIDANLNPMIPVVTMTHAQQALYKICGAAGPDRVIPTYRAMMNDPRRDWPFLSMRSVLSFYLSATIGQEARKQCLISD